MNIASIESDENSVNTIDERNRLLDSSIEKNDDNKTTIFEDNSKIDLFGGGQIMKKVLKSTEAGFYPQKRDFVTISYIGQLETGEIVESEDNLEIQLGDFEVIEGLDMAISSMKVGEISEISVNAKFAYGLIGLKSEKDPKLYIPPNSNIIYTIKLEELKHENDIPYTFNKRIELSLNKQEKAKFWLDHNEYYIGIHLYKRSIEYLDDKVIADSENDLTNQELQLLLENKLKAYINLIAILLEIAKYDDALKFIDIILEYQAENSKALYYKGKILGVNGNFKQAITFLKKAATLDPNNDLIQQHLSKLILKSRKEERNDIEMCKRMIGQTKKKTLAKSSSGPSNSNQISKIKLVSYMMSTVFIGFAGFALMNHEYRKWISDLLKIPNFIYLKVHCLFLKICREKA